MRPITTHAVNPVNEAIKVLVADQPGSGGACHQYVVKYPGYNVTIQFQNGPVKEAGINGLTNEVLLAILRDRLEGFQSGQFANEYNAKALDHIVAAQEVLLERTRERIERGVEGTHQQ